MKRSEDRIDLTSQTINGYRILHQLGSGGMADVYLAFHETLQRHVALKVMRTDLAASKDHLKRFLQEARSAASLVHPNIVQVYDIGNWERVHYIAQEYIAGNTLRTFIHRRGTLPQPETMSILLQTAAALQKAASIGVVHRDIKPDNILLTSDGEVKVADFGLARVRSQTNGLTEIGVALGTPTYMSPEQIQGQTVDARSDLYSLGATTFEMLAGRPPFEGETALALALQHVQNAPPNLRTIRPDVDEEFVHVIERLLAKNPEDRIGSAADLTRIIKKIAERLSLSMSLDHPVPLSGIFLDHAPIIGPHTTRLQTAAFSDTKTHKAKSFRLTTLAPGFIFVGLGILSAFFVSRFQQRPLISKPSARIAESVETEPDVKKQYFIALMNNKPADWRAIEAKYPPSNPLNLSYNLKAWLHLAWFDIEHDNHEEAFQSAQKVLDNSNPDDYVMRILAQVVHSMVFMHRGNQKQADRLMFEAKQQFENLQDSDKRLVEGAMPRTALNQWYLPIDTAL
jgi:serine/threonine-protein kinase